MLFNSVFLFTFIASANPCAKCHSNFDKNKVQKLSFPFKKEHQELIFKHMKNKKKCLLCHSEFQTNLLVTLDGRSLTFGQSPQLCGQCHGPVYFDWIKGIHGKRIATGTPQEKKILCINCHNPHDPKFKKMRAEPAPHKPRFVIQKQEEKESHGHK